MTTRKIFGTQYDDTILVTQSDFSIVTSSTKAKKPASEVYNTSDFSIAVFAGDGKDKVYIVGTSNDAVDGGAGDDLIYGGAGNDLLSGGGGKDSIYGGSGNDIIGTVRPGTTPNTTTDYVIDESADQIGDLLVGDGFDPTKPNTQIVLAIAAVGDDIIVGGNGKDTIWGDNGPGTDAANTSLGGADQIFGGNSDDSIYGQGGNDDIKGENGNDIIDGGAGNDAINGGLGADKLKGGAGADLFTYNSALDSTSQAMDIVADFSRASLDKIDLRPLLGASDLEWGGNAAKAYGVWQQASGANTLILTDTTGDALADMVIQLNGTFHLKNADFLGVKNTAPTLQPVAGITYNDTDGDDTFGEASGNLTGADSDYNDVITYQLAGSSASAESGFDVQKAIAFGIFFLNTSSGAYKFVAADGAIETLNTTQNVDLVVNTNDGIADSLPQIITLTFNGVNDSPVRPDNTIQAASVTEIADHAAGENATNHLQTGSFVVRDVDQSDTLSWWVGSPDGHRGELIITSISAPDTNGDRTVNWQYSITDATMDNLREGSSLESYMVHVSDRPQGTAGAAVLDVGVAINLTGTNDAPVIVASDSNVVTGSVAELASGDLNANSSTFIHHASGSFQVQDVDLNDTLTTSGIVHTSTGTAYGNLIIDSISDADGSGIRTVYWTYSVSDHDLDPLPSGAGPDQTFSITLTDGIASVAQDVVIAVDGAGDLPPLSIELPGLVNVNETADGLRSENWGGHSFAGSIAAAGLSVDTAFQVTPSADNPFALGHMQISLGEIDAAGNAVIHWEFVIADAEMDYLTDADHVDLSFDLMLQRPDDPAIHQTLTVRLNGSSDTLSAANITYLGDDDPNIHTSLASVGLVYGLGGDDILSGGGGITTLFAGDGNDELAGAIGSNLMFGEAGNDHFYFPTNGGYDYLWGGDGTDLFSLAGAKPGPARWIMDFNTAAPGSGGDVIEVASLDALLASTAFNGVNAIDAVNPYLPTGTEYLRIQASATSASALFVVGVGLDLDTLISQGNIVQVA